MTDVQPIINEFVEYMQIQSVVYFILTVLFSIIITVFLGIFIYKCLGFLKNPSEINYGGPAAMKTVALVLVISLSVNELFAFLTEVMSGFEKTKLLISGMLLPETLIVTVLPILVLILGIYSLILYRKVKKKALFS